MWVQLKLYDVLFFDGWFMKIFVDIRFVICFCGSFLVDVFLVEIGWLNVLMNVLYSFIRFLMQGCMFVWGLLSCCFLI